MAYYVDPKYEYVIQYLSSLGMTRSDTVEAADVLWVNLSKMDFSFLKSSLVVNHFQGSQHWSNKGYLAYHLATIPSQNQPSIMPQTWSSSYQSVEELVVMLLTETSFALCQIVLEAGTISFTCLEQINRLLLYYNMWSKWFVNIKYTNQLPDFSCILTLEKVISQELPISSIAPFARSSSSNWKGNKNIWIIKPLGSSCGEGIEIFDNLDSILDCVQRFDYRCLVQKYIERPLLVNNRKFDIRQWVLVKSLDPLVVFGYSECYIRLSCRDFVANEFSNPLIHLCNYSIQKQSTQVQLDPLDSMMSQKMFMEYLMGIYHQDVFYDILRPQIIHHALTAVCAVKDRLSRVSQGFEWLGMDFMISEDLKVWLIEVNTSPDISFSTPITQRLVQAAVPQLFDIVGTERVKNLKTNSLEGECLIESCLNWESWFPCDNVPMELVELTQLSNFELGRIKKGKFPLVSSKNVPLTSFAEEVSRFRRAEVVADEDEI